MSTLQRWAAQRAFLMSVAYFFLRNSDALSSQNKSTMLESRNFGDSISNERAATHEVEGQFDDAEDDSIESSQASGVSTDDLRPRNDPVAGSNQSETLALLSTTSAPTKQPTFVQKGNNPLTLKESTSVKCSAVKPSRPTQQWFGGYINNKLATKMNYPGDFVRDIVVGKLRKALKRKPPVLVPLRPKPAILAPRSPVPVVECQQHGTNASLAVANPVAGKKRPAESPPLALPSSPTKRPQNNGTSSPAAPHTFKSLIRYHPHPLILPCRNPDANLPQHRPVFKDSTTPLIPTHRDILLGRGHAIALHPGNVEFRTVLAHYRGSYLVLVRGDKRQLAHNLTNYFRIRASRFLETEPNKNGWFEAGDERAVAKCSQSLREGARGTVCRVLTTLGLPPNTSEALYVAQQGGIVAKQGASVKCDKSAALAGDL
jgi:hypothetical protein